MFDGLSFLAGLAEVYAPQTPGTMIFRTNVPFFMYLKNPDT